MIPDDASSHALRGHVSIVTGGTSGIGLATGRVLAARGANVVLASRRTKEGLAGARELSASGNDAEFVAIDVTEPGAAEKLMARAAERFGRIDSLVNCAGTFVHASVEDTDDASWQRVIETNLTAPFRLSRAAIPHLRAAGGGTIVNVSSVHAVATTTKVAAYATSKGGLTALSRQMAIDLAPDRIRVNCVVVGPIDTDMSRIHRVAEGGPDDIPSEAFDPSRFGRVGRAEEVAWVIVFLMQSESSFVTGAAVVVDGGMTARLF